MHPTRLSGSPATSRRLTAILDTLLDLSTALGTVREHQRLTDIRMGSLERHQHDMMLTLTRSALHTPPPTPTTSRTSTTAPPMSTDTTIKRVGAKLTVAALKEFLPWLLSKIAGMMLPYIVPGALALLAWATPFGNALLKFLGPLWRLIAG